MYLKYILRERWWPAELVGGQKIGECLRSACTHRRIPVFSRGAPTASTALQMQYDVVTCPSERLALQHWLCEYRVQRRERLHQMQSTE